MLCKHREFCFLCQCKSGWYPVCVEVVGILFECTSGTLCECLGTCMLYPVCGGGLCPARGSSLYPVCGYGWYPVEVVCILCQHRGGLYPLLVWK